jgi:hypothetical protein
MYIMVKVNGDIIFNVQNNVRCEISNIITKKLHNNPWYRIVVQKYILAPIYEQVNENLFRLSIRKINYEKRY